MIKNFSLALLFSCSVFYAQQQTQIVDAETQKPIPYAKLILKDKDYYKNTEENGEIRLKKDEEISEIQAFGYENLKVGNFATKFLMKPKFIEINEVEIARPKFEKNYKIGSLKVKGSFGAGFNQITSSFWGKVITFNTYKDELLFIKKISFKTIASNKNVIIRLLIYENINGFPGEILRSEEITCKAGHNKLQEFSPKQISFPKEGIIIGFEWIFNETNRYETSVMMNDTGETKKVFMFSPALAGSDDEESNTIFGSLSEGKWKFQKIVYSNEKRFRFNPAIQIELTN